MDMERRIAALQEAVDRIDAHPDPTVRAHLGRALDAFRGLHEEGVRRLASLAMGNPESARVAMSDPVVANLLHLHGLTDAAEGASVVEVLARGGADGAGDQYRVRLDNGDEVSFVPEANLRRIEERAVREEPPPPTPEPRGWSDVVDLDEVDAEGGVLGRLVHGYPVLLVRTDGVQAYRNTCPGSLLPVHMGGIVDGTLRCPWHGCRFDPATGARSDGPGEALLRLPVREADGRVEVELP